MSPTPKDKKDIRLVLNAETVTLIRRIAGITERSASNLVEEAMQDFFSKKEIQDLINLHKLDNDL